MRTWTVKVIKMPRQEKLSEIHCTDINSAIEYIKLVDLVRDKDVRITLTSLTESEKDINRPLKLICPTCGSRFKLAERCPECGQLFDKF